MKYEALRAELEGRLADLQVRLASIKRDATQAHSGDSAEQAQERENDEVVDEIGNETAQSIQVIRSALERIDNGNYGVCDTCNEEISSARLQAIPESTQCVDCAE